MSAKPSGATKLVWVDLETTGLEIVDGHEIIEMAVVVTSKDLQELGSINQVLQIMNGGPEMGDLDQYVVDMHTKNGLWAACEASTVTLEQAERNVFDFIAKFDIEPGTSPLAGSTVGFDRGFLKEWMPKLEAWFHYRNADVSAVQEFMQMWLPGIVEDSPRPREIHRALPDLEDSIDKARYYRNFMLDRISAKSMGW